LRAFLIVALSFFFSIGHAQPKAGIKAEEVIANYLKAVGGSTAWQGLQSRVADMAVVRYDEPSGITIAKKIQSQTNFYLAPDNHLELTIDKLQQSIFCLRNGCNWYYSEKANLLAFFGPEPIHFDKTFPRVNALEVLNLKMINKVVVEDNQYRIDFKDARQKEGIQSLYFDMESYLVVKRSYPSKTDVRWTFMYDNYQMKNGFMEPYFITLKANDDIYMTYEVKSIDYNIGLGELLFTPPKPCKNESHYERLDTPFFLNIN
jgi:hypothetical protein